MASQEAFAVFRPICVEVTNLRDKKSIAKLNELVNRYSPDILQDLQEYLLFPLRIIIQKGISKEDVILEAISCMKLIFLKTAIFSSALHQDMLKSLILNISEIKDGVIKPCGSEELKAAVYKCLQALFNHASKSNWKSLYCSNNIPILGHVVTICLSSAAHEDSRLLKVDAMCLLHSMFRPSYIKYIPVSDADLFTVMSGDCLSSFLPGILSTFTRILLGDIKQGHIVKCKALELTASILETVIGDDALKLANNHMITRTLFCLRQASVNSSQASLQVERNKNWLDEVSLKINILLEKIMAIAENPSMTVRVSLIQFCQKVLLSCQSSLALSVPTLLSGVVGLLYDDQPQVCATSKTVIDQFSVILESKSSFEDVLEDTLFALCSDLPSKLRKSSDGVKLLTLKLLCGYISIFKHNLKLPHFCLNKILNALLFSFELNNSNLIKIEDITQASIRSDFQDMNIYHHPMSNWQFQRVFVHHQDHRIIKLLIELCHLLGQYGNIQMLISSLLDHYKCKHTSQQAVMIINELLLGCGQGTEEQISQLLDVYTTPANWYRMTSTENENLPAQQHQCITVIQCHVPEHLDKQNHLFISPKDVNASIILSCLHLEALATFSEVLGEAFRCKLFVTLYPVLEKVGDPNHLISSCGLKTLQVIAEHCKYKDVADLIGDNADYLVNSISLHLRDLQLYPR